MSFNGIFRLQHTPDQTLPWVFSASLACMEELLLTKLNMLIGKDENVLTITGSFSLEKTLKIIGATVNLTLSGLQHITIVPSVHIIQPQVATLNDFQLLLGLGRTFFPLTMV